MSRYSLIKKYFYIKNSTTKRKETTALSDAINKLPKMTIFFKINPML